MNTERGFEFSLGGSRVADELGVVVGVGVVVVLVVVGTGSDGLKKIKQLKLGIQQLNLN